MLGLNQSYVRLLSNRTGLKPASRHGTISTARARCVRLPEAKPMRMAGEGASGLLRLLNAQSGRENVGEMPAAPVRRARSDAISRRT